MKKILCVAVFFCIAMALSGASKTRCRNCGINDGNIIYMCEKQHITCSSCARGREAFEAMNDSIIAAFGGKTSSMRCTKVNRYDKVCNGNITRKIADNRSPEAIRREQAAARQRAANAAKAKAAQEQKEQAGIKVLRAEHAKMLAAFRSALKSKSPATLKQTVAAMLKHHDNHDGYASKASGGIFGMFGGRSGGENCNLLNVMVSTALKLNDDKFISIIFANINPGDGVVLSGLKTGKPIYVNLFADKLKKAEIFTKAVPVIIETHCRLKNPAYLTAVTSVLKTTSFNPYDLRDLSYAQSDDKKPKANEILLSNFLAQTEKLPFAAIKPLYDVVAVEKLESILTQAVADGDVATYKYLIDKRKATGSAKIRKNDLAVYPYHLFIAAKNYEYAKKVKISPTMHEDKIEVWKEEQKSYSSNSKAKEVKRNKGTVPVAYMAELNNFDAVKYLIEKEGYDFGSFSKYSESDDARTWAKKHNNKEMFKYLDDKISGWTAAGYYTTCVLLAPLYILALLAAK